MIITIVDTMNEMKLHFLISCVFTWTIAAQATSFYIRPISEFTAEAPNIVRGTLHNIHTDNGVSSEGMKTIYTFAGFEVKEVLKGSIKNNSLVTIRKIGGTKDGYTLEVPSSPELKENEETVVFLSAPKEDQSYEVVGLELGKFGLEEKNGATILTGGIFNFTKPQANDENQRANDLSENSKVWSIDDLKKLIHSQEEKNPSKSVGQKLPTSTEITKVENKNPNQIDNSSSAQNLSSKGEQSSSFPIVIPLIALILLGTIFYLRKK